MSPRVNPPAGARWRVTVSMITDDGNEEVFYDQTGQAYVLAIGATTPTRITGEVDYNGDPWLCQRLATYIQHDLSDPPTR
jgi:hypothetical protein